MPAVSFIVPAFNCLPLTQAMTASLVATVPAGLDHEIILVDDGSTDGTGAWSRGLAPPFRVVSHERNLGYAKANNRGAALARGDRLVLLNNDLLLGRGWLEPMLAAEARLGGRAGAIGNVQRDFRTGAVDHAGIFINHKGKPEHCRRRPGWLARRILPLRRMPAVTGACLLIRADLWRRLGGFDEGYVNGCEDVDLCFRAADAGKVNAVAVRSVVRHHISATPGRKARDEANTRRLALRWGERLVELGQPDWCRNHFETHLPEPRDFPDPALARAIAFYLLHLRRRPPAGARPGMRAALGRELKRWDELL